MYYKLVAGEDIFELNPGLRAVPLFKDMTDNQMKYICLVCDPSHDNPVRTLQGKTKKEKAALLAGYKLEPDGKRLSKNARDIVDGKIASIQKGIEKFKELHYDENTDTYEAVVFQIGEIKDFLKSKKAPKDFTRAIKMGAELPNLIEARQKIETLLNVNTTIKPQLESTYTSADLPSGDVNAVLESSDEQMSIIDQHMKMKIENGK